MANAQAAVAIVVQTAGPQAAWYAEHLRRYRAGEPAGDLHSSLAPRSDETPFGEALVGTTMPSHAAGQSCLSQPADRGPGLLRMAATAIQAMARFLGLKLQTTSSAELAWRLRHECQSPSALPSVSGAQVVTFGHEAFRIICKEYQALSARRTACGARLVRPPTWPFGNLTRGGRRKS